MTLTEIRALARVLGALLPWRLIVMAVALLSGTSTAWCGLPEALDAYYGYYRVVPQ